MENNVSENPVLNEQVAQSCDSTIINTENLDSKENIAEQDVDFTNEEAACDAENADLELGAETEEESASTISVVSLEDIAAMSRNEIIDLFKELLATKPVVSLRKDVEAMKVQFYKIGRQQIEAQKRAYIDAGGAEEEFEAENDGLEPLLKELFSEYRTKRDSYLETVEQEKENNLKVKLQIIEELKELVNSSETMNNTFATFRELQQRWKDSGLVPKNNMKDLWETYHMHVENFYNFVKINNELRDLDLKRNYEIKIEICEEAELLLMEESVVAAFNKLQKLHDRWRESGPVAVEFKESLWERFKEVSSKINKKHQDHFEAIKQEQISNLALKTELCEKSELLSTKEYTSRKEWDDASNELVEIQKVWKTIGYAPKRDNNKIYARFREACDVFFEKKREFFVSVKSEMENNLQQKIALCTRAEAIAEGSDWKKGAADLISLQKEWKEIGVIPRKQSDAVWKRFRAACDLFFEKKSAHFASMDEKYEGNLAAKKALIEEIRAFSTENAEDGFNALKEFQRRFMEIGFVPMKLKDAIQKEYKELIDTKFTELRGSDAKRKMDRFKERVSSIKNEGNSRKMDSEKERILTKIKNIESDIVLWENNIGFFAGGKNSQKLIDEVNNKIEKAKREILTLKEKLAILN
ncbi:MAG: DUF349 domain-containing protein [Rikenellaceae bacterium]